MPRLTTRLLGLAFALAAALAATACGELTDPDQAPALLTVRGALTGESEGGVTGDVRVALVWVSPRLQGGVAVSQDVAVSPEFPARFALSLTDAPPEDAVIAVAGSILEAFTTDGEGVRFALGGLLAYEDRNGNGALDLVPADATDVVDRVIAASDETSVVWIEGGVPSVSFVEGALSLGYNLLATPACLFPNSGPPCPQTSTVLPPDHDVDLALDDAPALATMMCEAYLAREYVTLPGEGPPPAPGDAGFACADDGTRVLLDAGCEDAPAALVCRGAGGTCTTYAWELPEDPAGWGGWPCPIEGWCEAGSLDNPCATDNWWEVPLDDGPYGGAAIDDGWLYFGALAIDREDVTRSTGSIRRVPLAGGEAELLYERDEPPTVTAAGDGVVRWLEQTFGVSEPGGTPPGPQSFWSAPADGGGEPTEEELPPGVLSWDDEVAWVERGPDGSPPPRRMIGPDGTPYGERAPVDIVRISRPDGAETLVAADALPRLGIVITDDTAWWRDAETGALLRASADGAGAELVRAAPLAELPGYLVRVSDEAAFLLAPGFPEDPNGTLTRLPLAVAEPAAVIASGAVGVSGFAFDADAFYWVDALRESVLTAALDGSGASLVAAFGGEGDASRAVFYQLALGTDHLAVLSSEGWLRVIERPRAE